MGSQSVLGGGGGAVFVIVTVPLINKFLPLIQKPDTFDSVPFLLCICSIDSSSGFRFQDVILRTYIILFPHSDSLGWLAFMYQTYVNLC